MKVVVVGINHAGTSAIRTLLSINKDIEVIAFDKNSNISFLGCGIALSISGVVKNTDDLFYSNPKELTSMGAKIHMNHEVIEINRTKKYVKAIDLETQAVKIETYDKLIYGAGSWPVDLHIKNQDLKNIEICKIYQHALQLIAKANDPNINKVVVVGGGYIGVELAEAFKIKGKQVVLIDTLPHILQTYFDVSICQKLEENMKYKGINLFLNQKVTEFKGDKDKNVTKVVTNKETIKADLVIMCVGFKPNTYLLPELAKIENGALMVNKYSQTSDKDIYAIGDCAAIYHAASKTYQNVALATNAVKLGIVAASQICGLNQIAIPNIVGTNAISVFGLKLASTGLNESAAKKAGLDVKVASYYDNDRPEWMNDVEKVQVKLVYESNSLRLVGAQILSFGNSNHTEWIFALALAIQMGLNLYQVAFTDVYFIPHFNKPFNFVLSAILKSLGMKYIK